MDLVVSAIKETEKPSKKAISSQLKYYYRHRAEYIVRRKELHQRSKGIKGSKSSTEDDVKKKQAPYNMTHHVH